MTHGVGPRVAGSTIAARRPARELLEGHPNLVLWVFCGTNILTLTALALVVVIGVVESPLSYDEAYNLQVSTHLAATGSYATDGSLWGAAAEPFDVYISTGPTVLVPVAGLFALFGNSLFIARLIPTFFFLLLVAVSWVLGRRVGGRWAGVVAVLSLLTINTRADWPATVLYGTGDVLGEVPAAALLMLSAVLLPRRTRLSGLIFGVAVLTKFVVAVAGPAFLIAALSIRVGASRRSRHRDGLRFLFWAMTPLAIWQLVKLLALGEDGYRVRTDEFLSFLATSGSGLSGSDASTASRLSLLSSWYGPLPVVIAVWLAAGMLAGIALHRSRMKRRSEFGSVLPRVERAFDWPTDRISVGAGLGGAALVLLWWLAMSSHSYTRHIMPAVLLMTPILAALSVRGGALLNPARSGGPIWIRTVGVALLSVVMFVQVAWHVVDLWQPPGPSLAEQQSVARVISNSSVTKSAHTGWWQNPDLTFLSGKTSRSFGSDGGLLVVGPVERFLEPEVYAEALANCYRKVYESGGYVVCWASPNS